MLEARQQMQDPNACVLEVSQGPAQLENRYQQGKSNQDPPPPIPVLVSSWPLLHVPADCGPGPAQQIQTQKSFLCWEEAPATQML